MSSVFVDTSALVKFYYPEADSDKIEALLLKSSRIYISQLHVVEMASALMKKVRDRDLQKLKAAILWNTFLDDLQSGQIETISIEERHYFKAADLVQVFGERYGIKTLDALHLAVAHALVNVSFLCADKPLSRIARMMGIKLMQG